MQDSETEWPCIKVIFLKKKFSLRLLSYTVIVLQQKFLEIRKKQNKTKQTSSSITLYIYLEVSVLCSVILSPISMGIDFI